MTDRLTIHSFEITPAWANTPTMIRFRLSNGLCSQVPRTRFPQLACLSERSLARFAREPGKVVWTFCDVSLTAEQLADAGLHPDPLEKTLMSPSKGRDRCRSLCPGRRESRRIPPQDVDGNEGGVPAHDGFRQRDRRATGKEERCFFR